MYLKMTDDDGNARVINTDHNGEPVPYYQVTVEFGEEVSRG